MKLAKNYPKRDVFFCFFFNHFCAQPTCDGVTPLFQNDTHRIFPANASSLAMEILVEDQTFVGRVDKTATITKFPFFSFFSIFFSFFLYLFVLSEPPVWFHVLIITIIFLIQSHASYFK